MNAIAIPRVRLEEGALSALKWLGLALMVLDHVDAFVFGRSLTWACALGRLVFPLFAFVVAYNLARPGALERGVHARMLYRLGLAGCIALPFHAELTGATWPWPVPGNIMFTFAVAVAAIWAVERRQWLLALAAVPASFLVEYSFPGVVLVVVTWLWLRWPTLGGFLGVVIALGSLTVVNGSQAALWALPVVLLASGLQTRLPRAQWLFYAFYPAHLAAFWLALNLGATP